MHFGGWGPGRARFFALNLGDPVDRGIFTQLADTDRQHDNGVGAFRIVIQAHFRAINNDTFMHGVRQDQLLWNI